MLGSCVTSHSDGFALAKRMQKSGVMGWGDVQELSPAEREAVFAFLSLNVEEFEALAPFEIPLKVTHPPTTMTMQRSPHHIIFSQRKEKLSFTVRQNNTCHCISLPSLQ